ncbi:MAG: CapA family protein [Spirochaetes bacterium]|nr:CapA family protein [Spirochaetota bacterium]
MKKTVLLMIICFQAALFSQMPAKSVIKFSFTGDMMIGTEYPSPVLPPNDGKTFFNNVKEFFSERDVVIGNLEGAITTVPNSPKNTNGRNVFAFRMPPRYAPYFKEAGYDVLTVANNHALDFGLKGNQDTIRAITSAGIKVTGEKNKLTIIEKNGIKIGVLGYSWYEQFNNLLNIPAAKKLISDSRKSVDILIVVFHGGSEGAKAQNVRPGMEYFYKASRGDVVAFSHAAIDSGADLVVGHGPHVLRGVEKYKNKMIAYSLGNFATYGMFNMAYPSNISVILNVDLDHDGNIFSASLIPIILKYRGIPEYDPKGQGIDNMNRLSKNDFKNPIIFNQQGVMIQ